MLPEDARPRLAQLGFRAEDAETLAAHFLDAEARGQFGHGLSRIEWLETWEDLNVESRPRRVEAAPGYERWDGEGALGYLTLEAVVRAQLLDPPEHARLVVCSRTFPTGSLGYSVTATDLDGNSVKWEPFREFRSWPAVIAGTVQYVKEPTP